MKYSQDQISKLASAFSRELHLFLGPLVMAEIVKRNKAETNPRVCHTHDFCDANQAMANAFLNVLSHEPGDLADDIHTMKMAWDQAKKEQFKDELLDVCDIAGACYNGICLTAENGQLDLDVGLVNVTAPSPDQHKQHATISLFYQGRNYLVLITRMDQPTVTMMPANAG